MTATVVRFERQYVQYLVVLSWLIHINEYTQEMTEDQPLRRLEVGGFIRLIYLLISSNMDKMNGND